MLIILASSFIARGRLTLGWRGDTRNRDLAQTLDRRLSLLTVGGHVGLVDLDGEMRAHNPERCMDKLVSGGSTGGAYTLY